MRAILREIQRVVFVMLLNAGRRSVNVAVTPSRSGMRVSVVTGSNARR